MKILPINDSEIIMSNEYSKHNYFGWPTAARLKNGRIAVAASGFRLEHICPFGKSVLAFSEDEGGSYTRPGAVIDTVLDDRDAGLCPFGESGLIFTSFNNRAAFQKAVNEEQKNEYCQKYLESITPEEEARDLGSNFRISQDHGVTFGPIFHSPVTSPHGPVELKDGTVLWVGRMFQQGERYSFCKEEDYIAAYGINPEDGSMTYRGRIEHIFEKGEWLFSSEPHTIQLMDGSLVCHIRVANVPGGTQDIFTIYQSKSFDGGYTWSPPRQILEAKGGAPAHLMVHSSGTLISTYGYREEPYGIRCAVSTDLGENWSSGHWIYKNHVSSDLGYPSTVELMDGRLLTVFYAHPKKDGPAVIMQQKWELKMDH